jgi:hypothetical protein
MSNHSSIQSQNITETPNETEIKVHDISENNISKINAESP